MQSQTPPPHIHHSPSTIHNSPFDRYRLLLFLAILAYILLFTNLAFEQHLGMRTHRSDLGQIDQAVWNSSRGRFLEQTDNGYVATRLTDHVEPILVLISPIFWVWDDVRALLLLQVVAVALGAWPLYELALCKLDQLLTPQERTQIWQVEPLRGMTRPLALIVACAYLLAPQLQSAVLTEFHAAPLAAPLVLWAFWSVERRHMWQFAIAALLVALVKEEMALLAAGLGLWALWRLTLYGLRAPSPPHPFTRSPVHPFTLSPRHLVTLSVILLSLAWFYIATFVIVPAHAAAVYGVAESGYFARYGALGDSPLDIFKSFFTQPTVVWQIATEPARVAYLRNLLLPFGFLSLLAPEIILLSLPVLLANLLSAYPAQYYGEFHYSAPLAPYFAVSAAYGLGRIWRWLGGRIGKTSYGFQHLPAAGAGMMNLAALLQNSRTALRPLLALTLGIWLAGWAIFGYANAGRGPLGARYDPTPINAHEQLLSRFVAQLPAEAAVTATAAVHPHVSHRRYVYQFPLGLDAPAPADWALLDVTTNTDMAPGDVKRLVDAMLAGDWGVVDGADGFLLMHKGALAKTVPEAFYDFTRLGILGENQTATDMPLADWALQVGSDWPRWRQTQLQATLWNVGPDFDPQRDWPTFSVVTPDGKVVYTMGDVTPPALVWRPLTSLQAGDTFTITSLPSYLPRVWALVMSTPPTPYYNEGKFISLDHMLTVVEIYDRITRDRLHPLFWGVLDEDNLGSTAGRITPSRLESKTAQFQWGDKNITVESWLPVEVATGSPVDLWLQWRLPTDWPDDLALFAHLRRGDENQSQADGPPRMFLTYDVHEWLATHNAAPDWRQLPVPDDAPIGESWSVVVGLYDPTSGQRADVIDATGKPLGNEFTVGQVKLIPPPAPDQTCALIPATCASQAVGSER